MANMQLRCHRETSILNTNKKRAFYFHECWAGPNAGQMKKKNTTFPKRCYADGTRQLYFLLGSFMYFTFTVKSIWNLQSLLYVPFTVNIEYICIAVIFSLKSGERKNYLYYVFQRKREHSSHSVVVLYLKTEAAWILRYKTTTEWLECSFFSERRK